MRNNERTSWRDSRLGVEHRLDLPVGALGYFESGTGPPMVFVHGLLVNANLWRKTVAALSSEYRCIALDLPLGSHRLPMPADADLAPYALADLIADTIAELGLEDVTLVGNDMGGLLCQMVVTRRAAQIGRLVLTSCDYREKFPPPMFSYLKPLAYVPGALEVVSAPLRFRAPRRSPLALGWLAKRPIDRDAEDSYVLPAMTNRAVARDVKKVIRAAHKRYSIETADRLWSFDKPALVAWSSEDRFFKRRVAERLLEDLPNDRLAWIDDSYTFSPEDAPEQLADLVAAFARTPLGATAPTGAA